MSEISLSDPVISTMQVRKKLEKSIKKEVLYNLRLAEAKSRDDRKANINKPKTIVLGDIVNKISSYSPSDEISEGRIRTKVFEETVFRSASKYKASPEKLNMLIVLDNPVNSRAYFDQLAKVGDKLLSFPDLTKDIKEGIIFGVQDLTGEAIINAGNREDVWARIITQSQYKQMKFKNLTMIIQA